MSPTKSIEGPRRAGKGWCAVSRAYRFTSRSPNDDEIMCVAEEIATARAYRTGDVFTAPELSQRYFKALLAHRLHETFAVAFLDAKHRLIACVEMFNGTIDGCTVPAREVVRAALSHNAAAVILAHNHPSGETEPSAADRAITQRLREALELVEVRVLDHIVVGGNGTPASLAQRGWL